MERPAKRARLLGDEEDSASSASSASGSAHEVENAATLTINDEYAKRFEHNKKREDLHRLQEKYGSKLSTDDNAENESDSESESEDDEGDLATKALDDEILATLQAIRNKDPRVYDKQSTFFSPIDPVQGSEQNAKQKEKPIHLRDYHRQNLLNGNGAEPEVKDDKIPRTYGDEQSALKKDILQQINKDPEEGIDESDEEGFLVRKPKPKKEKSEATKNPVLDVESADRDPETFLSNFMASRAWTETSSRLQPFESDDESDDNRAEEFEAAYNMRFENPEQANQTLKSHSREAAAKFSVRRDEKKGRRKNRELEQATKEAQKAEQEHEKARFRRLKIEEAQEQLLKFKEAAGLKHEIVPIEDWSKLMESGWDSEKWNEEMAKRFGDAYYAGEDGAEMEETKDGKAKRGKKKIKKPKWDDEIDIGDLLPEFDEEERRIAETTKLSDDENGGSDLDDTLGNSGVGDEDEDGAKASGKKRKRGKDAEQMRHEKKRQARKERQKIEELVDQSLVTNSIPASSKHDGGFRYRETSPSAFGLTAREILMADDSQLNQFAGLKKLASFRDPQRKKKDKKALSKKARLRQWRKDTFGNEEGPSTPFDEFLNRHRTTGPDETGEQMEDATSRKKRRSKKRSGAAATTSSVV